MKTKYKALINCDGTHALRRVYQGADGLYIKVNGSKITTAEARRIYTEFEIIYDPEPMGN